MARTDAIAIILFLIIVLIFYLLQGWIGFALFALLFWVPLISGRVIFYLLFKGRIMDNFKRTGVYSKKFIALFYLVFWLVPDIIVLFSQKALLLWAFEFPFYLRFIGLAIFLTFVVFCGWMFLHLGWRARLTGKPEPKLVVSGPYAYIRHPEYSSELWALFGIFLVSGTIMILILIALWAIFIYPVTVWEEKELEERFGDEYKEYCKQVPRIFFKFRRK